MSKASDKLQQRAQLIAILNKYRQATQIDNVQLNKDIEIIANFENKNFVCKTLFQEITDTKTVYANICAIILIEAIDVEIFEKEAIDCLQKETTPDEKKFFIMSLIKQKGIEFNFKDISNYIDTPEELAHNGVVDFLQNAINDPEVQIDLLDFFINIPKEEKIYFLENLLTDFEGDNLANAFSILVQVELNKEEFEIIFDGLSTIDSPYAIEGLEYILQNKKLETKTKTKIKRIIKKLQEKYPNFSNDNFVKDTQIFKSYISFVDGHSNFSLVLSRIRADKTLDALLATININDGVNSCMGFSSITLENFLSIIKRLFNDSLPVEISPTALKSLFEYYYEKSKKNNIELPYELIVWKKFLNNIRTLNYDISEFINSKLEITKLTQAKVKKFSSSKITETWYYSVGQNKHVDNIIEEIEKRHTIDLDEINEIVSKSIDENFLSDNEFLKELQSKLLLQSYVANLAKLKMTSACAYSLCFKNPYLKTFIHSSIDKSLYYAFSTKAYELEEKNRFKKNAKTNFSKEELELIMSQLEEKWS